MTIPENDPILRAVAINLHRATRADAERLAKLTYLVDWRAAITLGRTITSVPWTFDGRGPVIGAVSDAIARHLKSQRPRSLFGMLGVSDGPDALRADEWPVLTHVVDNTSDLDRLGLHRLLISTYPSMVRHDLDEPADLPELAITYRDLVAA